ncbi:hypothetical protein B0H16DRAFT_1697778 [Mycena metata]|uniref:Uncharacterized protein n=1 Tax=Mycena metata TaxID=1033252 RepID=A0AAD7HU34_9AGAR|nr:hypothetical protein B0H16DRAFT_1697778 [Mycena metata]
MFCLSSIHEGLPPPAQPASVGQPAVAGTDRPRDINVRATIRTLHVDGGPVKKEEEVEVKVEEWDEVEGKIATSDQDALSVAAEPHAPTPALESSTQKRVSKLPASVIKSKDVEPKASKASASSASGSSAAPRPTVKHTIKSAMPPTDVAPAAAVPPAKSSPQKRVASEMDSESDDSRKRVRVKEKPLRSQRKTRATQNAA